MTLIRMSGITKRYPGTVALDRVDFHLNKGEIVSLLGENGAGKTTLMKVLYGMTMPEEGDIFYKEEKVRIRKPMDAIDMGICMVHQHFMLVPAFTVTENIIVGSEPHKGVFLDLEQSKKEVGELISQFCFHISPDTEVEKLSVGEQQRVEILKALYRKADVIILDEPTAVLTPKEVDELFEILRTLKKEGKSIILITHKLKETIAIADRVVILRDGRLMKDDVDPALASIESLSEMMVGRHVDLSVRRPAREIGEVCLHVKDLCVTEDGQDKLKQINLDVHRGEILGIAGIEGNGQTQLIEALTGLRKPQSMTLDLDGTAVSGSADVFLKRKIVHIPEDRLKLGLVKELSIRDNLILGYHREPDFCNKYSLLKRSYIRQYAKKLKERFLVKAPSVETAISSLSGGNQQKVVIARAFSRDPDALIIAHPTRGVDIGAMEYIHQQMTQLRDSGKAILLISADLDEVRVLSDRILVLYEGEIVRESMPGELSEVQLGLLMTGAKSALEKGVWMNERENTAN